MTLDTIITLITLLLGGGGIGSVITWRYTRGKAKVEVDKEKQDYYQQLIDDLAKDREDRKHQNDELRAERDHYKTERNELRDEVNKLREEMQKAREEAQKRELNTDRKVARLSRKVDAMRPFLCADPSCKKRQLVTIFDGNAEKEEV
jgi:predicted RNase H-like nuclease (RuvC/YqgF family)